MKHGCVAIFLFLIVVVKSAPVSDIPNDVRTANVKIEVDEFESDVQAIAENLGISITLLIIIGVALLIALFMICCCVCCCCCWKHL